MSKGTFATVAVGDQPLKGVDVGCGANLIYPLLGAAIYRWQFVATDITDVAIQWAQRNADSNPQLAPLIEVRRSPHASSASEGMSKLSESLPK